MDDIREQIGMSMVKADDMDAIGQSGAANLLRMNVKEIERLTAELAFYEPKCSKCKNHLGLLAESACPYCRLTARNELLEAVYEAALAVDANKLWSHKELSAAIAAVQTTEHVHPGDLLK